MVGGFKIAGSQKRMGSYDHHHHHIKIMILYVHDKPTCEFIKTDTSSLPVLFIIHPKTGENHGYIRVVSQFWNCLWSYGSYF